MFTHKIEWNKLETYANFDGNENVSVTNRCLWQILKIISKRSLILDQEDDRVIISAVVRNGTLVLYFVVERLGCVKSNRSLKRTREWYLPVSVTKCLLFPIGRWGIGVSMCKYCNVFTNDFFTTINIRLFFKHFVDIVIYSFD